MEFYFQGNSVMNSLKCPKSKSLSHCHTELFPIYQNKHWTIRWRDDRSINPSSHCIILKIVGFQGLPRKILVILNSASGQRNEVGLASWGNGATSKERVSHHHHRWRRLSRKRQHIKRHVHKNDEIQLLHVTSRWKLQSETNPEC